MKSKPIKMRKKIFMSILAAALAVMLLSTVFIAIMLYRRSNDELCAEVQAEAFYISTALNREDEIAEAYAYLDDIGKGSPNRVTLVGSDGVVLFDNYASPSEMQNHISRPEISDALSSGEGEATRASDTIGKQTYYYAIKLESGNVLRIANTNRSVVGVLGSGVFYILTVAFAAAAIAVVFAYFLTLSVIRPINALDLASPLSNNRYEELFPLFRKMEKQNREIEQQMISLTEQRAEFDMIISDMNEGMLLVSSGGIILSANKSALKLFNAEKYEFTSFNKEKIEYGSLCDNPDFISAVSAALSARPASTKLTLGGKCYRITANPVPRGRDDSAAVVFAVDITASEHAEAMRREFSANVSHELKTPLTYILGCAEIINNGVAKKDDIPSFAGKIHSEATRLLSLIEDIIKLSRLDEDDLKAQFEPIELLDICRQAEAIFADKAEKAGVEIISNCEPAKIMGFRPVLCEMVYNLCDNAISYNKPGGYVKIALKTENNRINLTISDNGVGIAPEHQSRVFERFYRVDKSHSKETGGTGLGLSIVKHGAMLHGAGLTLTSLPGKGTEVRLTFSPFSQQ